MGRDLRLLLYAGIHWSGYYVSLDNVARIQSLLGLPLNQRRQVVLDDASDIPSFISRSHLLNEVATSGSWFIAFSPLLLTHACHTHAIGRCFDPNHWGRWT